jgi:hypothetical protein
MSPANYLNHAFTIRTDYLVSTLPLQTYLLFAADQGTIGPPAASHAEPPLDEIAPTQFEYLTSELGVANA